MKTNSSFFTHLSEFVEMIPDAIIVSDKQGTIILVNRIIESFLGYEKNDLLGKKIEDFLPKKVHSEYRSFHNQINDTAHKTATINVLQLSIQKHNGEELPIELHTRMLENEDQVLNLITIRDLSLQRQCEAQLKNQINEYEQVNVSKDKFLATMSHQLRTPLNAILGFSEILLAKLPGEINAEQEKQLKIIHNSGKSLLTLINDLSDLAKIDSGRVSVSMEELDAEEFIVDLMTTLKSLAVTKQLSFTHKPPNKKITFFSDKHLLTQIMINIINNAIKFTESGSVSIELTQKKFKTGNKLVIKVIDTGIGIKQSDLEQLFQAFHQIYIPGKKQNGSGLGLFISKKLADLMHIKFKVMSEYGQGTQFLIKIPLSINTPRTDLS